MARTTSRRRRHEPDDPAVRPAADLGPLFAVTETRSGALSALAALQSSGLVRAADPATSQVAAAAIAPHLSELQKCILRTVRAAGAEGLTGKELENLPDYAACSPSTVRKRVSELVQLDRLRANGQVRDGCTAFVAV